MKKFTFPNFAIRSPKIDATCLSGYTIRPVFSAFFRRICRNFYINLPPYGAFSATPRRTERAQRRFFCKIFRQGFSISVFIFCTHAQRGKSMYICAYKSAKEYRIAGTQTQIVSKTMRAMIIDPIPCGCTLSQLIDWPGRCFIYSSKRACTSSTGRLKRCATLRMASP